MKKDWCNNTFTLPTMHRNNSKQVSFSRNGDEVVYIYPWSPTKYLMFGKYTENELELMNRRKRQKVDHTTNDNNSHSGESEKQKQLTSILKRNHDGWNEDNIYSDSDEEYSDPCLGSETKPLEELETTKDSSSSSKQKEQETNEPFLPSMAIFSPSGTKDLMTNNPTKDVVDPTNDVKRLTMSSSNGKMLRSTFEVIGKQRPNKIRTTKRDDTKAKLDEQDILSLSSSSTDSLPLLLPSPTKLNEAVFGCIKSIDDTRVASSNERKVITVKMPSIITNGSLGKPLIKTSRSSNTNNQKRFYSTINYKSRSNKTFDNIQLLREEQFDDDEGVDVGDYHTPKNDIDNEGGMTLAEKENLIRFNRINNTELPTIKDAYKSSRHNHRHHQQQHHQKYRHHQKFPKKLHRLQPHSIDSNRESLKIQLSKKNQL